MGFHLAASLLTGILLGQYVLPESIVAASLLAVAAATVGLLSALLRPWAFGLALLIVGTTWSGHVHASRLADANSLVAGQPIVARGIVSDEAIEQDYYAEIPVRVLTIRNGLEWQADGMRVLVHADPRIVPAYGEYLEIAGTVTNPTTSREYERAQYLRRRGVAATLDAGRVTTLIQEEPRSPLAMLLGLRAALSGALRRELPEPEASLAAGILLGARDGIPPDLRETFKRTGVSHLIAISGYNVSLLVAALTIALRPVFGRRWVVTIGIPLIVVYAVLVGGAPSVLRAAAMGCIALVGLLFGRDAHPWTLLAVGSAAVAALEPSLVLDIGFQLSVLATAALFAAGPLAARIIEFSPTYRLEAKPATLSPAGNVAARAIRLGVSLIILTSAATLVTAPVLARDFQQLSIIAPVSNLLVAPAFPVILVTTGAAAIGGAALPNLTQILAYAAWPFLFYFVRAAEILDLPAIASFATGRVPDAAVSLFYATAAFFGLLADRRREFGPAGQLVRSVARWVTARPLWQTGTPLALACLVAWALLLSQPSDGTAATFLEVPGDSVLIQSAGRSALIDGGSSPSALVNQLGRALPFSARQIDILIISGLERQRLDGLRTLARHYQIGAVVAAKEVHGTVRDVLGPELRQSTRFHDAQASERIFLGPTRIDLLAVSDSDDARPGELLIVVRGTARALLLAGAVTASVLKRTAAQGPDLTAEVARVPQLDPAAGRAWDSVRSLVNPYLEVVRSDRDAPRTFQRPTHRLGLDGKLIISLDDPRPLMVHAAPFSSRLVSEGR